MSSPEPREFPFMGPCTCGWPLLADGSCSNGECPDGGWVYDYDDADEEMDEEVNP